MLNWINRTKNHLSCYTLTHISGSVQKKLLEDALLLNFYQVYLFQSGSPSPTFLTKTTKTSESKYYYSESYFFLDIWVGREVDEVEAVIKSTAHKRPHFKLFLYIGKHFFVCK